MLAVVSANEITRPMGCRPVLSAAPVPSLTPTIAPLGSERLIRVSYVHSGDVVVRGAATGREYRFTAGEAREIPLADARILVSEGDFAFSGGR